MIGNGIQILISNNGASQVTTTAVAVEVGLCSCDWLCLFSIGKISECLLSVSHIDFEVLWSRNRRCDALKGRCESFIVFVCKLRL